MSSDPISPAPLRLVCRVDGEFTMYVWLHVVVVVWDGPLSVRGAHHIGGALPALRAAHAPFSLVHLLKGRTGLPSAEVRTECERLSKAYEESTVCTAILDDRQGFAAGAIKAVVTGVLLITRARFKIRIFSDVQELVTWLVPMHRERAGVQLDQGELRTVLRAAHDAHP